MNEHPSLAQSNSVPHWHTHTHTHSARKKTFFSLHCRGEVEGRRRKVAHISIATEETAWDKCLGIKLMSYTSNWRFFTPGPLFEASASRTVVSWEIDGSFFVITATDHAILTDNHQQQTPVKRSDASAATADGGKDLRRKEKERKGNLKQWTER